MLPEHRRILRDVRTASARALGDHQDAVRRQRGIARRTLRLERARLRQAAQEYRHCLSAAKAEAQQFRVIWEQARKDGRRLLEFVDRHLRRRAA